MRNAKAFAMFACLILMLAVATAGQDVEPSAGGGGDRPKPNLAKLVQRYFLTDDAEQRASMIEAIDQAAEGSAEAVMDALRTVEFWPPLPEQGRFSVESGAKQTIDVVYRLPEEYESRSAYPVLLCIPDRGVSPADTIGRAREALRDAVEGFVLAATDGLVGAPFQQHADASGDLRRVVMQMRRLIHTDTDRLFVFGEEEGGEAAWLAAIMQGDLLAGAISVASFPRVPFPETLHPYLLANVRHVPVLSVWRAPDPNAPPRSREALVAQFNHAILSLAERMGVSVIGVEVPRDDPVPLVPPRDAVRAMLGGRRAGPAEPISHWFRYPDQGHAGWLRQTEFAGEVWKAEQLSFLVEPPVDRDEFIREMIRGRLAYVGGRIEGQDIAIVTQKCAKIDVLVSADAVDWTQPVTVRINGLQRLDERVRPDLGTLLETSRADWDFQRFTVVRRSFSIKADGTPP